jgi:hypothetical protein
LPKVEGIIKQAGAGRWLLVAAAAILGGLAILVWYAFTGSGFWWEGKAAAMVRNDLPLGTHYDVVKKWATAHGWQCETMNVPAGAPTIAPAGVSGRVRRVGWMTTPYGLVPFGLGCVGVDVAFDENEQLIWFQTKTEIDGL